MKAKLVKDTDRFSAGETIDHPQAFRLVQIGIAECADEECETRIAKSVNSAKDALTQAAAELPDELPV